MRYADFSRRFAPTIESIAVGPPLAAHGWSGDSAPYVRVQGITTVHGTARRDERWSCLTRGPLPTLEQTLKGPVPVTPTQPLTQPTLAAPRHMSTVARRQLSVGSGRDVRGVSARRGPRLRRVLWPRESGWRWPFVPSDLPRGGWRALWRQARAGGGVTRRRFASRRSIALREDSCPRGDGLRGDGRRRRRAVGRACGRCCGRV